MKKILLGILFLPSLLGLLTLKSSNLSDFSAQKPSISRIYRSTESDGFLAFWLIFREENPAVCDITYDAYKAMYEKYSLLSKADKEIVNASPDIEEGYTIGSIIKTLVNKFYPNNKKVQIEKQKLDQSTTIIIATVVALVGASAISVLYILKNNKVIE